MFIRGAIEPPGTLSVESGVPQKDTPPHASGERSLSRLGGSSRAVGGRDIDDEAKVVPIYSACILLHAEMAKFEYQSVKAQSFSLKLQSFSLNSEMILLGGESLSEQAECFLLEVESFLLEVRAQALKGEYFGLERDIRKVTG